MARQTTVLRDLLAGKGMVVAPGAVDGISARIIARAGYPAVCMTGSGVAATLGFPDIGIVSMAEQIERARCIARSVAIPVIADGESGFGQAQNIVRTVREFEAAGVAAMFMEDQRPGSVKVAHLYIDSSGSTAAARSATGQDQAGSPLFSPVEMAERIAIAAAARTDKDFVIIARTDEMPLAGIEAAIARSNLYAEAGADLAMIQQPRTAAEVAAMVKGLKVGLTISTSLVDAAGITTRELEELGVKVALYPIQGLRAALKATVVAWEHLRSCGTLGSVNDALMPRAELRALTGEAEFMPRPRGSQAGESRSRTSRA